MSQSTPTSNVSLVLTVIGADRPGLVEKLAKTIAEHSGNWLESRMAHLAGQFAGILRVEVPPQHADALKAAVEALAAEGLQSLAALDASAPAVTSRPALRLDLVGHDRAGVVQEISGVLAAKGANVEELHTEAAAAANTGQPLFRASILLRLPAGVTAENLQSALEGVAPDMMVDIRAVS